MAKVIKQGSGSSDFLLEDLQDADMPASYAPGNWDTAFSWGDHAAAGYGLLIADNSWTGNNRFNSGSLLVRNLGWNANLQINAPVTADRTAAFPDKSGTVALTDDIVGPGGTANQLQVNDGSGGLAGTSIRHFGGQVFLVNDNASAPAAVRQWRMVHDESSGALLLQARDNTGAFLADEFSFGHAGSSSRGAEFGSPAGGFPGAGKINAEGLQVDGANVWHSGNLEITQSAADSTSGRVTKVGDFGLGRAATPPLLPDFDAIDNPSGFYLVTSSTPNVASRPSGFSAFGVMRVYMYTGSRPTQHYHDVGGKQASRFYNGTTWDAWQELWHSGNLEYDTDTVELGGDFNAGEEVKCVRVGDQVTITGVGELLHTMTHAATSNVGVIPAKYRPSTHTENVFYSDGHIIRKVFINSNGTFEIIHRAGGGNNTTSSTFTQPSITYNV